MTHNLSEYELMHNIATEYGEEIERLLAETERYRRALEFYANMDNYFCQSLPHYEYADPLVVQDWGERARAALTPPDNGIAESE